MLTLLRIILVTALLYYLIRYLGRWLGAGAQSRRARGGAPDDRRDERYDRLTDQKIEDADFEEIEEKDKG